MDTPERILRTFSRFAVVGASRDAQKAAHGVPATLQKAGFMVVPVNPHGGETLFGQPVYPTLEAIPTSVDVVVVFRPSEEAAAVAHSAAAIGARALWLQSGITSRAARTIAEEAGMLFVEDRCTAVERAVHQITKAV